MADSKSSGTDTVVKVVLIFFISLLSFSIGTFVGKKFSDNQHKMASLEPQNSKSERESEAEGASDEAHNETNKNHHASKEAAMDPENKVSARSGKSKVSADEEELTDEQAAALEDEMVDESELKSGGDHAKAENTHKMTRMIASEMAQKGIGKYTIQVAAYSSQEEAEKKVKELKSMKLESFSTETTIKGHQWYRVNVGLFATIKEAQSQKALLADQSKITGTIIQKISK